MTSKEKIELQQRVVLNVSDGTFLTTMATKLDVLSQNHSTNRLTPDLEEIREELLFAASLYKVC